MLALHQSMKAVGLADLLAWGSPSTAVPSTRAKAGKSKTQATVGARRARMDLDLGVIEDDYDPRKPEYIRPATADESYKLDVCIAKKQIEKLESVMRKRSGYDPTVSSHYDRVANALRVSAGFLPRVSHRRVRSEPDYDWAQQVAQQDDDDDAATMLNHRRIRSQPSDGWAHQPIVQQNVDAGTKMEDAKIRIMASDMLVKVQVPAIRNHEFQGPANTSPAQSLPRHSGDTYPAHVLPLRSGNTYPAQMHALHSGAQTQYGMQQGRWVQLHGHSRMAASIAYNLPKQPRGGGSSLTFSPALQYRNHLGQCQQRMPAVLQQIA